MNRILSVFLVLTLLALTLIPVSSFDENTSIETSDLGAQIIDTLGHNLVETKDNWGDLLAVFYIVVIFLSSASLLLLAILMTKQKSGKTK